MGDAADDAFDAALASMMYAEAFDEDDFEDWPYDARYRRGPEVARDNENKLTRLRQSLKATGGTIAGLQPTRPSRR